MSPRCAPTSEPLGEPDVVGEVRERWQPGRSGAVGWWVLAGGWGLLALNMAVAGEFSDAALRLVAAGCAALLAVGLVRRCAWSDGTALHVREFRTRTVPWAEVTEIYQHKGLLNDSVRLQVRDGSPRGGCSPRIELPDRRVTGASPA